METRSRKSCCADGFPRPAYGRAREHSTVADPTIERRARGAYRFRARASSGGGAPLTKSPCRTASSPRQGWHRGDRVSKARGHSKRTDSRSAARRSRVVLARWQTRDGKRKGVIVALKDDAANAARHLLDETWGDRIPVDPVQIARRLGIDVVDARLGPDVSGALVKERDQDPSIFLNALDSKNRKRFSCAHELGHFVRRKNDPDRYEYVDFRGKLSRLGMDMEEIFANNFAAALLMPEERVRELHKQKLDEVAMAVRFDVSLEAMHNRLQNLKLI